MITWAERIKDLRDIAGLTLLEIGKRTGMATTTVSDLAQGRSTEPRGNAAVALHELHKELCGIARKSKSGKQSGRADVA